jgi:hypothetical protein
LRPKASSKCQRAIGALLRVITFGGMSTYVSAYHTVMGGTLWVSEGWSNMSDLERYVLLRHERIHLVQARRWGIVPMGLAYLLLPLPLGFAYARARIEWEAYLETLHALVEVRGLEVARSQKAWLRARFVGPDYGWMFPFASRFDGWFDDAIAALEREVSEERLVVEETLAAHRRALA